MLNTGIIEWSTQFADGFEYDILHSDGEYPYVRCYNGASHYLGDFPFHDVDFDLWKNVYYPLFLQRVIEGINIKNLYIIQTNQWVIEVYGHNYGLLKQFDFNEDYKTIDEAKEASIEYVYKKLNK